MNRKSWGFTLAAATVALLPLAGYLAFRKYMGKKGPIALLDVKAVAEKSLPGRAAAQYLRTIKNILERNIESIRKQYAGKENSLEAIKAVQQAQTSCQQQILIYQRKLDEEIDNLIEQAVHTWLAVHSEVTTVMPTDSTLGYKVSADITDEIMAEIKWYKPSFPPLPREKK